jgi:hypothetical protein
MYLVFGTSKYGKTDHLPGLFHVMTEFFHVYYVPLVPLRSAVHMDNAGEAPGTPISMSGKSVLVTYLRGLVGVAAFLSTLIFLGTMFNVFNPRKHPHVIENRWLFLAAAVVGWFLVALSYRWTKPSPVRALELANTLDLPMESIVEHYLDDPQIEAMINKSREEVPG